MDIENLNLSEIRRNLHGNVAEIMTSLELLSHMEIGEQTQLLGDLLQLCMSPKFATNARELVQSIPRAWLLANIEQASEPYLQTADSRDYLMLLGLFESVDQALARRLARRASLSEDFDIKEVGVDFLNSTMDGP
jgi:hypothetical protein